jgi:DNA-binding response OmpR family regulator
MHSCLSIAKRTDLLQLLARHAGRVVPRADITLALRGTADVAGRGIDTQVCRLRRALAEAALPGVALRSVRQVGYRLYLPEGAAPSLFNRFPLFPSGASPCHLPPD